MKRRGKIPFSFFNKLFLIAGLSPAPFFWRFFKMKIVILHNTAQELKYLKSLVESMKTQPSSISTLRVTEWKEVPVIAEDTTYVVVPPATPFSFFLQLRAMHDILTISEETGKFKRYRQWAEQEAGS